MFVTKKKELNKLKFIDISIFISIIMKYLQQKFSSRRFYRYWLSFDLEIRKTDINFTANLTTKILAIEVSRCKKFQFSFEWEINPCTRFELEIFRLLVTSLLNDIFVVFFFRKIILLLYIYILEKLQNAITQDWRDWI